jgi:hypothetical protein
VSSDLQLISSKDALLRRKVWLFFHCLDLIISEANLSKIINYYPKYIAIVMRYMDFYIIPIGQKKNPIRFKMNGILGICFGIYVQYQI